MFGFNSAKYHLTLVKSYLLPILVNERDIEQTNIKKANQFISFKFGDADLNIFNLFLSRLDRISPSQFQGVQLNGIPIVENLLLLKILLYDVDVLEGNIIGELARQSVQKHKNTVNTVRLLRYNLHICYVSNINAVFQSYCCPNCDTFFNITPSLERYLNTGSERLKIVFPRNVYQVRETLFYKLDPFGNKNTSKQKLF